MIRPLLVLALFVCLVPALAGAEILTHTFSHQALVADPAKDYEHRIDLPEAMAMQGKIFVKRDLDTRMGKLVVVTEEFTPMYYYIKVRLPKVVGQPMGGQIKIDLTVADQPIAPTLIPAPEKAHIFEHSAARKPVFVWESKTKYAAVTLFDVAAGKTIWERISTALPACAFDEGYLPLGRYKWAVKQGDATGRWSTEVQKSFQIVNQNGIVVIIEE